MEDDGSPCFHGREESDKMTQDSCLGWSAGFNPTWSKHNSLAVDDDSASHTPQISPRRLLFDRDFATERFDSDSSSTMSGKDDTNKPRKKRQRRGRKAAGGTPNADSTTERTPREVQHLEDRVPAPEDAGDGTIGSPGIGLHQMARAYQPKAPVPYKRKNKQVRSTTGPVSGTDAQVFALNCEGGLLAPAKDVKDLVRDNVDSVVETVFVSVMTRPTTFDFLGVNNRKHNVGGFVRKGQSGKHQRILKTFCPEAFPNDQFSFDAFVRSPYNHREIMAAYEKVTRFMSIARTEQDRKDVSMTLVHRYYLQHGMVFGAHAPNSDDYEIHFPGSLPGDGKILVNAGWCNPQLCEKIGTRELRDDGQGLTTEQRLHFSRRPFAKLGDQVYRTGDTHFLPAVTLARLHRKGWDRRTPVERTKAFAKPGQTLALHRRAHFRHSFSKTVAMDTIHHAYWGERICLGLSEISENPALMPVFDRHQTMFGATLSGSAFTSDMAVLQGVLETVDKPEVPKSDYVKVACHTLFYLHEDLSKFWSSQERHIRVPHFDRKLGGRPGKNVQQLWLQRMASARNTPQWNAGGYHTKDMYAVISPTPIRPCTAQDLAAKVDGTIVRRGVQSLLFPTRHTVSWRAANSDGRQVDLTHDTDCGVFGLPEDFPIVELSDEILSDMGLTVASMIGKGFRRQSGNDILFYQKESLTMKQVLAKYLPGPGVDALARKFERNVYAGCAAICNLTVDAFEDSYPTKDISLFLHATRTDTTKVTMETMRTEFPEDVIRNFKAATDGLVVVGRVPLRPCGFQTRLFPYSFNMQSEGSGRVDYSWDANHPDHKKAWNGSLVTIWQGSMILYSSSMLISDGCAAVAGTNPSLSIVVRLGKRRERLPDLPNRLDLAAYYTMHGPIAKQDFSAAELDKWRNRIKAAETVPDESTNRLNPDLDLPTVVAVTHSNSDMQKTHLHFSKTYYIRHLWGPAFWFGQIENTSASLLKITGAKVPANARTQQNPSAANAPPNPEDNGGVAEEQTPGDENPDGDSEVEEPETAGRGTVGVALEAELDDEASVCSNPKRKRPAKEPFDRMRNFIEHDPDAPEGMVVQDEYNIECPL